MDERIAAERVASDDWREQAEEIEELDRIARIHSGIDFSLPAWVIENSAPGRPWTLPSGFDLDQLEDEELRVGVTLGIFTLDVLTSEQRRKLRQAYRTPKLPLGTAQTLLRKLSAASDEFTRPRPAQI